MSTDDWKPQGGVSLSDGLLVTTWLPFGYQTLRWHKTRIHWYMLMLDLLWYLADVDKPATCIQLCESAGFVVVMGAHRSSEARSVLVDRCDGLILMGSEIGDEGSELFFEYRNKKRIINCVGMTDEMTVVHLTQWRQDHEQRVIQTVLARAARTTSRNPR